MRANIPHISQGSVHKQSPGISQLYKPSHHPHPHNLGRKIRGILFPVVAFSSKTRIITTTPFSSKIRGFDLYEECNVIAKYSKVILLLSKSPLMSQVEK